MDPLALAFVALASVLHAGWNIVLKTSGDPRRAATIGMVTASVVLLPLTTLGWLLAARPSIPAEAWLLGTISGLVEVAYFTFLAAAYRRGDLSVVYPLARGTAPLIAVAIAVGLLGERLSLAGWAAVALLLIGLLMVQQPWRLVRMSEGAGDRAAAGFALLTGVTIATYTAIDSVGVRVVAPWIYAAILFPVGAIGLLAIEIPGPRFRARGLAGIMGPADRAGSSRIQATSPSVNAAAPDVRSDGVQMGRAIAGGLLMLATYGLVLAALSRAPLALVAPLRESAVLLTATWGVVRLGEAAARAELALRLGGSMLVLAGAATLAVAR